MLLRKKSVLFGILFLVIATALVVYYTSQQDSGYTDVTVEQAKELIDTTPSLVIIDVRTEAEYNAEHIAGATNIPLDELSHRLGELDPKDTTLIYCRTGNRSTQAAEILVEQGFADFYHMYGGIVAWKQKDYPVTT